MNCCSHAPENPERQKFDSGGNCTMETYGLENLGIINASAVYRNLTPAELTEHALRRS